MSAAASTAPTTSSSSSEVTIRTLNSSITTFSRPFNRAGAEVGVRMSAIRLSNGDLVLYNPTELDAPTQQKLTELGTVKYVITPNLVHHMFAAPYAKAYPQAKFIGPDGIQAKKKDDGITFAVEMKDPNIDYNHDIGWGTDMVSSCAASPASPTSRGSRIPHHLPLCLCVRVQDHIYFRDFAQKEIMLCHLPTKTVFLADMVWNLPAIEAYEHVHDQSKHPHHASKYGLQSAFDHHLMPEGWMGKALAWAADKVTPEFKKGMHKLLEQWTPAIIVPEHGEVITAEADKKLRSAFSWVKWDQ